MKNKIIKIFKNTKIIEQDIINDLDEQIESENFSKEEFQKTLNLLKINKKNTKKVNKKMLFRIGIIVATLSVIMCCSIFVQGNNYLISDNNIEVVDENVRITLNEKKEKFKEVNIEQITDSLTNEGWNTKTITDSYYEYSYTLTKGENKIEILKSKENIKEKQLVLCGPFNYGKQIEFNNETYYIFENTESTYILKYGENKYFYILSDLKKEDLIKILS